MKWTDRAINGNADSEAIAVLEHNGASAHVCFVSPAIRNTHPSVEDAGNGVKVLPTLFYRELLRPHGIAPAAGEP